MKAINTLLILLLAMVSLKANAGDIDYIKSANGIILIGSKSNMGSVNSINASYIAGYTSVRDTPPIYSLELYSDGEKTQYAIRVYLWSTSKKSHIFPSHSKMLLKLTDNSIIELTSVFNDFDIEKSFTSTYFPISESELQRTFSGITKTRMEVLSINKDDNSIFTDYQDYKYKKDKMGKQLEKWHNAINEEYRKKGTELLKQKQKTELRDINEDF